MIDIVNPRQTVLVTCRGKTSSYGKEETKDNIITLDWHTPLSFAPMMYAISVAKKRFSFSLLNQSKVFAVNFMSIDHEKEVLYCGRNSGINLDKFRETKLEKIEAEKIDCPIIKQALAYLECEIIEEVETGDHVLFISKVLKSKTNRKGKRIYHTIGNGFVSTQ